MNVFLNVIWVVETIIAVFLLIRFAFKIIIFNDTYKVRHEYDVLHGKEEKK